MTFLNKKSFLILIILYAANTESTVLTDAEFPYRIVCASEWVQQEKNDTMLVLHNTTAGKKTRLQLKKYDADSGFNTGTKEWSRLRFFVNHDIIVQFGKIIFVDTAASKKLGGYRAYEIFAFFWEKTGETTLWMAEYVRWTDNNGFGYMASIIGDTLDMKENIKNKKYVQLLDSITLSQFSASTRQLDFRNNKIVIKTAIVETPVWYDFLGRNVLDHYCQKPKTIIVKKNMKHGITK